jgi:GrpB-like predicted nucleotidyltransferase (UPF0157 family)
MLRMLPPLTREYAELKRRLATRYNAMMGPAWASTELNLHYTEHKSDFVARVLAMAEERIGRGQPIVLAPYDPAWPHQFEAELSLIAGAAGDLSVAIEHVGSTSLPGLSAKPKIDIALGVRDMRGVPALIEPLRRAGYDRHPEDEDIDDWVVFTKREGGRGAVNLHIVPHAGQRWRDYLLFRDELRSDPSAARRYEALKQELAREFGSDHVGYPEAKGDFVAEILERARTRRGP